MTVAGDEAGRVAVDLEVNGAVAWIRLSRPRALNAIDEALSSELHAHLDSVDANDAVRVVVLTGTGRAFCAGADLKALLGVGDPRAVSAFVRRIGAVVERLAAVTKPVIAAVNGLAMAGGIELILACDLVVAASTAVIGDAHSTYGLFPGAGGGVRLPRVVGATRAKRLLFTGESLPAAELVAWGLVNEVVAPEVLESRAAELAGLLAAKSPLALAAMKRLVDDGLSLPVADALRLEADAFDAHARTSDFREGLAAFNEKRVPDFGGR